MAECRHLSSNLLTYPCHFSTDSPIPAGNQNRFIGLVWNILGGPKWLRCKELAKYADARLGHSYQG